MVVEVVGERPVAAEAAASFHQLPWARPQGEYPLEGVVAASFRPLPSGLQLEESPLEMVVQLQQLLDSGLRAWDSRRWLPQPHPECLLK